VVANRHGPDNG